MNEKLEKIKQSLLRNNIIPQSDIGYLENYTDKKDGEYGLYVLGSKLDEKQKAKLIFHIKDNKTLEIIRKNCFNEFLTSACIFNMTAPELLYPIALESERVHFREEAMARLFTLIEKQKNITKTSELPLNHFELKSQPDLKNTEMAFSECLFSPKGDTRLTASYLIDIDSDPHKFLRMLNLEKRREYLPVIVGLHRLLPYPNCEIIITNMLKKWKSSKKQHIFVILEADRVLRELLEAKNIEG
jgi:hypothetical protein